MPAQVENEPAAERFARHSCTRSTSNQRNAVFRGITDQSLDILLVARRYHTDGLDLQDAGVGAVQCARNIVEENFSAHESFQVIQNSATSLFVHVLCPSDVR